MLLLAHAAFGIAACKDAAPVAGGDATASSSAAASASAAPIATAIASATASATPSTAVSAAPAPIDSAIPTEAPHSLERHASCTKVRCTLAHLVPDEVRPSLSDSAPAVVWEQTIGERASLAFPRDAAVELAGVVLEGQLDLTPMEVHGVKTVGGPWAAFRAPGGGVTLRGTQGKAVRLVLVVAVAEPAPPAAHGTSAHPATGLGAHIDRRDRRGAPLRWNWRTRRKRIDVVALAERPDVAWGGGAYHARIGWEASRYRLADTGAKPSEVDDQPAVVIDLLHFSADAGVAEHTNDHAWESLAVLEGEGALVKTTPSGEERIEAHPGTIMTLPSGTKQAWRPSGKAPFFAIQVFAPAGPEQGFKKLAGLAPAAGSPGP